MHTVLNRRGRGNRPKYMRAARSSHFPTVDILAFIFYLYSFSDVEVTSALVGLIVGATAFCSLISEFL